MQFTIFGITVKTTREDDMVTLFIGTDIEDTDVENEWMPELGQHVLKQIGKLKFRRTITSIATSNGGQKFYTLNDATTALYSLEQMRATCRPIIAIEEHVVE